MDNVNFYNQAIFEDTFKTTETYSNVIKTYDNIIFNDKFELELQRQFREQRNYKTILSEKFFNAVPWHFLKYLDLNTNESAYFGKDFKYFKEFIPALQHIELNFNSSIKSSVNRHYEFFKTFRDRFVTAISIVELNDFPLSEIRSICTMFGQTLQLGGRGFITVNATTLLGHRQNVLNSSGLSINEWVRSQFDDFPFEIVALDITDAYDAWLNGNIRIVIAR